MAVSHAGIHPVWLEGAEPGKYRGFIDRACADAWTKWPSCRGRWRPRAGSGTPENGVEGALAILLVASCSQQRSRG